VLLLLMAGVLRHLLVGLVVVLLLLVDAPCSHVVQCCLQVCHAH
jgi:hypothetical protein